jgi:hypothetical protein
LVQSISSGEETVVRGPPTDRDCDVPVRDGGLGSGVDDHGAEGSGGGLAAEVAYSLGQGCHWADCPTNCIMMDKCPFGSIFGVGNGDGGTIRSK